MAKGSRCYGPPATAGKATCIEDTPTHLAQVVAAVPVDGVTVVTVFKARRVPVATQNGAVGTGGGNLARYSAHDSTVAPRGRGVQRDLYAGQGGSEGAHVRLAHTTQARTNTHAHTSKHTHTHRKRPKPTQKRIAHW
jgi:hypothetical protein